ncbi:unnamed protein product [Dovyalis caffra]|uniref:Secreted protein n=1 Tax=Dovyalis caffra TaxID=77055 RepID=A0AAV1QS45_9ROSI|nr:unnamed protein product [Dovyalis caffra]
MPNARRWAKRVAQIVPTLAWTTMPNARRLGQACCPNRAYPRPMPSARAKRVAQIVLTLAWTTMPDARRFGPIVLLKSCLCLAWTTMPNARRSGKRVA